MTTMDIDATNDEVVDDAEASGLEEADASDARDADSSGSSDAAEAEAEGRGGRWRQVALLGVAALIAISGVTAWAVTARDGDRDLAASRDAVLIAGRQNIETLTSLDYRKVDDGLTAWADASTGDLRDQLTKVTDADKQLLADQKTVSTGKVVDAAVTELDGNSASVIASVEITVNDDSAASASAEPTLKRNRFVAELQKVKGEWKLSTLNQVPVNVQ